MKNLNNTIITFFALFTLNSTVFAYSEKLSENDKVHVIENVFTYLHEQNSEQTSLVGTNLKHASTCKLNLSKYGPDDYNKYSISVNGVNKSSGLSTNIKIHLAYKDEVKNNLQSSVNLYEHSHRIPRYAGARDFAKLELNGNKLIASLNHKKPYSAFSSSKISCVFDLDKNLDSTIPEYCGPEYKSKIIATCSFKENYDEAYFPLISGNFNIYEHYYTHCENGQDAKVLTGHSVRGSEYKYKYKKNRVKLERNYLNVDLTSFSVRKNTKSIISTNTTTSGGSRTIHKFEYNKKTKEADIFFYYFPNDMSIFQRKAFSAKFSCEEVE